MNSAIPAPMSANAEFLAAVGVKAAMHVRLSNRPVLTQVRPLQFIDHECCAPIRDIIPGYGTNRRIAVKCDAFKIGPMLNWTWVR